MTVGILFFLLLLQAASVLFSYFAVQLLSSEKVAFTKVVFAEFISSLLIVIITILLYRWMNAYGAIPNEDMLKSNFITVIIIIALLIPMAPLKIIFDMSLLKTFAVEFVSKTQLILFAIGFFYLYYALNINA